MQNFTSQKAAFRLLFLFCLLNEISQPILKPAAQKMYKAFLTFAFFKIIECLSF